MKKKVVFLLCLNLIFLCACDSNNGGTDAGEIKEPDHIVYYTIGTPDDDLEKVNEALNLILEERYSLTVDYRKIQWNEYGTKINQLINLGNAFDVAFVAGAGQGDYADWALKGKWLCLDDFLRSSGKEIYDEIAPLFWKGVSVNGKVYGIPTNKEIAATESFMYPKEIVEKYNININDIKKLDDLEPIFEMIKENEPDYTVFELDKESQNFFALYGYEYVLNKEVPIMVRSEDEELRLVNIFETDEAKEVLNTLNRFYDEGYINIDAPKKQAAALEKNKKVFCKMASGGPYSDASWSKDRGYELVSNKMCNAVATTESTRAAVMVVNALSENKEAALRFLVAVNTDPEVRNLLNYGILNEHYILDANEQVISLNDKYSGVQYTQGNWFILNTRQGEPKNKWEIYKEYNENALASNLLGFQADMSEMTQTVENIKEVWNVYYPALMTGCVDVDEYLPKFCEELKNAGIDDVIDELQRQVNEWNKSGY